MFKTLLARVQQGHRTLDFPRQEPRIADRFRGRPQLRPAQCAQECRQCLDVCPTDALTRAPKGISLDLGRCTFCALCSDACGSRAIEFTNDYRLAVRRREQLVLTGAEYELAAELGGRLKRLYGRSLRLRQVSAGGCNGCEVDINVLTTVVFDLGRFGIQIVASPRHADGLLVTGAVTENMRLALEKTYAAVPGPKLVIAVGACAISGGPFAGNPEVHNGCGHLFPVDLFVPGCPPHPLSILDGILRLLGRRGAAGGRAREISSGARLSS